MNSKYVRIYQNAKHGEMIKKLHKWVKCTALQEAKYTNFLKSLF